mgnify:FL=1
MLTGRDSKRHRNHAFLVLIVAVSAFLSPLMPRVRSADAATVLVEAEHFEFPNGWLPQGKGKALNNEVLFAKPPEPGKQVRDAMTMIRLPAAGTYHVWTRALDFATYQQGVRRYKVWIDRKVSPRAAGQHGDDGFAWEKVDTRQLESGRHMLGIRYVQSYPRADAVLLTTTGLDPNRLSESEVREYRIKPDRVYETGGTHVPEPPAPVSEGGDVARIANSVVSVDFTQWKDAAGKTVVKPRYRVRTGSAWHSVAAPGRNASFGGRLFVLHADSTDVFFRTFPHWKRGEVLDVDVRGETYQVLPSDLDNPFRAGSATLLVPRSCRQVSPRKVEVTYEGKRDFRATAVWQLPADADDASDIRVELDLKAPRDGYYSVGVTAPRGWHHEKVEAVQLPPIYQFQRVPDRPRMIMSSVTSHPLSLAQGALKEGSDDSVCVAMCAEPESIDFRWFHARNARYGFTLTDEKGRVRPTLFTPVLGLEGSHWRAGENHTLAWRILMKTGTWTDALDYFSDRIMGVTDYRSPIVSESPASLTDAALNMIDLIRNPDLSGWNAELKGFWNIEMRRSVTQAAPLALLSAAMLGRDEYFFQKRALPSLEYVLTRPMFHSGLPIALGYEGDEPAIAEKTTEHLTLGLPDYGAAFWAGVENLTGRLNPWLEAFFFQDGDYRNAKDYRRSPTFSEKLAAYRLDPSPDLLAEAREAADRFIASAFEKRHAEPVNYRNFYNISFYPYWWDLIDLYELTGDKSYLQPIEEGAFHTVAGLWSTPPVPDRDVVIHPDGKFAGASGMYYRGNTHFRLGHPRDPHDGVEAQSVPAWQVAQVGLGVEQPSTYIHDMEDYMWNIQLPPWAPNLLRAYQVTGRDIFRTYARNAIIGRFANYSGYGVPGYTNIMFDSRYPIQGPDLTRFYFHHIPVHLGVTLDYLFTQAMTRSKGQIDFSHSWQNGYAYFVNRVFGLKSGQVYGEEGAVPWLRRDLVDVGDGPETATFVDWLAARSEDRVFVILMSQKKQNVSVPVRLNAARAGLRRGQDGSLYTGSSGDAMPLDAPAGGGDWVEFAVDIPAMGIAAVSLPAETRPAPSAVPPLRNGHQDHGDHAPYGQLHTFRFRTPFGKDAIYVVFLGGPPKGGDIRATLKDSDLRARRRKRFPYEFTFYPVPMKKDASVELEMKAPGTGESSALTLSVPSQ